MRRNGVSCSGARPASPATLSAQAPAALITTGARSVCCLPRTSAGFSDVLRNDGLDPSPRIRGLTENEILETATVDFETHSPFQAEPVASKPELERRFQSMIGNLQGSVSLRQATDEIPHLDASVGMTKRPLHTRRRIEGTLVDKKGSIPAAYAEMQRGIGLIREEVNRGGYERDPDRSEAPRRIDAAPRLAGHRVIHLAGGGPRVGER